MSRYCTKCEKELSETTKFCAGCGAKVELPTQAQQPTVQTQPTVQPTKQFCKSCGKELPPGVKF